ncbi:ABI family, member 3 (NESH) binding protein b precursor [Danio rerio]|uniref:ABI family, member 3 (NESH) binding protein b precursor n=1 Tax=Danio rerio TaxID=7955 RepID=Q7ZW12_DANRE|nr:ABI family, member 3 (NESH) binding protein b precursor [Danio rerio]AAH45333.1 Zgc:55418 [Danio rerio]AAI65666.1 Zgc:55418 protein [Danio rerio]|eukprot:NP_956153.1 target of Nesh-SH3 precursor [Danio rerio]
MAGSTVLHLGFLLTLAGILLFACSSAQRVRVRRQNMKVRINATGDTIVLKFVRPNPDVKLEGYILGYGSSMFSKQFIQLPENGEPYETEIDAEPKYLVAVQPMPTNDVKKHCTGKVNLEKPLHLVIDSVTPTSVLLSWGTYLKTPYEGNIMNDCLEEGHYTIRYRERNRKWIYQTCSTSDTVIDNLKPNTPYEFGVRPNKDDRSGMWSKPVIHNTNMGDKIMQINYKHNRPIAKPLGGPHSPFPLRPVPNNISHPVPSKNTGIFGGPKTSFAPPMGQQGTVAAPRANEPKWPQLPLDTDSHVRNDSSQLVEIPRILPQLLPTKPFRSSATPTPQSLTSSTRAPLHGHPQNKAPSATQMPHGSSGKNIRGDISSLPSKPANSVLTVTTRNQTSLGRNPFSFSNGMRHSPPRLGDPSRRHGGSSAGRPNNALKNPNVVGMHERIGKDMKPDVNQDKASILMPKLPPVTAKPSKPKTTSAPSVTAPKYETWENSSSFSPVPASKVDAMGKERYIAPHVVYKTDKKPDEPCSITTSLTYFPEEEGGEQNVTNPPKTAPSNLTVVTVEGCPSFIILDWEKTDNETTEYEVISTTKGPDGEQVSILTTNQTHTAVENLKPESSYEFKVKPKNELGEGPSSEPVSFSTESADPRVSENVSGKDAIWTQFPFKTDSYSECNGKQYVKRTWYRKFVGVQLCNSLRYKIYLSDSLNGKFHNIGDQTGFGEDHCQFVDSFLDGRTGTQLPADQLPSRPGFYRAMRQEPVHFGQIGGNSHVNYVAWYECGTPIPGKW